MPSKEMSNISKAVYEAINRLIDSKTPSEKTNAVRGLKALSDGHLLAGNMVFQVEPMSQQAIDVVRKEFIEAGLLKENS